MDRRSAIKNITLSFGTITLSTGTISIIQSCQTNPADWNPKFFSLSDLQFLEKVLEIIIPETDSPGAKSLKLVRFVDRYIDKKTRGPRDRLNMFPKGPRAFSTPSKAIPNIFKNLYFLHLCGMKVA